MTFLDFLARMVTDAAQSQRDSSAAQARQQAADRFAAAWNCGAISSIPSQLVWSVPRPDGGTAPAWPGCAATIADGSSLLLTFVVPPDPDTPVTADDVARHDDAIRLAARGFFGVPLRVTGVDVVQHRCSLALSPVNPACDDAGKILAGFDDRGEPVWVPVIGQVTAIAGDDGAASWISACVSGVIPTTTASPHAAVSDARRVGLAAKTSGQPPAPMVVGLEAAQPGADPERADYLGFARRGLVEWDAATSVDTAAWAVRPTQVISRNGDQYVLEQTGKKTPFFPAWLY